MMDKLQELVDQIEHKTRLICSCREHAYQSGYVGACQVHGVTDEEREQYQQEEEGNDYA